MTAALRDLVVEQGTSWTAGWTFRVSGQPMFDHTCTIRAQVRKRSASSAVLHEWSTELGNAHVDDTGTVLLFVAPAESSAWTWDYGVYDLEVTKADVVHRMLEGSVTVSAEVTR